MELRKRLHIFGKKFTLFQLPSYSLKIEQKEGKPAVFDPLRKRWIVLTPEEFIRQNIIQYLIQEKNFPAGRIAVEYSLKYNALEKRCDILVFDKDGKPLLLVECKAPEVTITQEVFDQIARYNFSLQVPYLFVGNGNSNFICKKENDDWRFLVDIPHYEQL